MKVIFISSCYAKGTESLIRSKCRGKVGVQNAPNAFQWSVIKGLYDNGADFEVVSFPLLPIFPARYKSVISPSAEIEYNGSKVGRMYSYCTVIGLKPLSIRLRLKNEVKRLLKQNPNEKIVLLLYSTNSFFTKAVTPLTKQYPNVEIAAIITDLIDDAFNYKSNNTFLKRIQINKEIRVQKAYYKYIKKFILLTKAMEERIPEAVGKNIVVEGICDRKLDNTIPLKNETEVKTILYTGTLQKYVGINDFVDAFTQTRNPNYRLIICGAGPSEDYICEKTSKDHRIIYKGVIPREEALKLQQEATIVVNPRKPIEEITKYSFPSKTIEYLASGTPMIGYRLEGIPHDYYQYIYSPEDLTESSMVNLIDSVLNKDKRELEEKAQSAKLFIANEKSAKVQVAKILDFLNR